MNKNTENKYTYYLEDTMYINVTNLCCNNCVFCIRSSGDTVGGVNLVLDNEKITSKEIIEELKVTLKENTKEIVFCGYGEPLIKLDIVKETANYIKNNYPQYPTRINTNGQANLIHKRNIVPELVGIIDSISVSLNSDNAEQYQEISKSSYGAEAAFNAVKDFIGECSKNGIKTTATVVVGFEDYKINSDNCRKISEELGAEFRIREWLPEGYS